MAYLSPRTCIFGNVEKYFPRASQIARNRFLPTRFPGKILTLLPD